MITWTLLFLLVIHVNAQLNTCITPEGNDGICTNIWDCKEQVKYIFSQKQNSTRTYSLLQSVCAYTNSSLKICCLKSNLEAEKKCDDDNDSDNDVDMSVGTLRYNQILDEKNNTEESAEEVVFPLNFLNSSDHQMNNNTIIIINMNNPNSTDKKSNTETDNGEEKISKSLLKTILCLILGHKSNETLALPPSLREENTSSDEDDINYEYEDDDDDSDDEETEIWSEEMDDSSEYVSLPIPPFCGKNEWHIPYHGEYPWLVLIRDPYIAYMNGFCKGTLITREHVITSARCVDNKNVETILVFSQERENYVSFEIKEIKIHEEYLPYRIQNDIALITLKNPIYFEEAAPICLKLDSSVFQNLSGTTALVPGFQNDIHEDDELKSQTIISTYECLNNFYERGEYLEINSKIICAMGKQVDENICLENEGSPLLAKETFNNQIYYYQIGMVSRVNYCSQNIKYNRPGIYLNINAYLEWILINM